MIVVLCFEFVSVESINCLTYGILALLQFLINFVGDIRVAFYLLFNKFDHHHAILGGLLVHEHDPMGIDGFIKDNVLDLALALAVVASQLIHIQEIELEFKVIIPAELNIVQERH